MDSRIKRGREHLILALTMAHHTRLGIESPLKDLPESLLVEIMERAFRTYKKEEATLPQRILAMIAEAQTTPKTMIIEMQVRTPFAACLEPPVIAEAQPPLINLPETVPVEVTEAVSHPKIIHVPSKENPVKTPKTILAPIAYVYETIYVFIMGLFFYCIMSYKGEKLVQISLFRDRYVK